MALGGRHHALGPLVDAGDRRAGEPGGERRERLDRDVELAPKTAAAGARHDPHLSGGKAQDLGRHVPVHDRRLGRDGEFHPVSHAPRPAGLRLDIGVLDESRLEAPLGRHGAARQRRLGVAALHRTLDQPVAVGRRVDQGRIRRTGLVQAAHRRQRLVADRQVFVSKRRHRLTRAYQGDHGVAAVAHDLLGQHRLVAQVGIDADAVRRHVGGAEHPHDTRPGGGRGVQVAEHHACGLVRRADDAEPERVRRHRVGAIALGPGELGRAVELGEAGADGGAGRRRREGQRRVARRVEHRRHYLAVAGAAAEDAAEAVHHLRRAGAGAGAQQLGRGDQHAGRAGAALGCAVAQEGPLQPVQPAVRGESLHGLHMAAGGLGQRHHAAADLGTVEQHRAGAAVAGVAAHLRPGKAEVVAQRIGESSQRRCCDRHRLPVDRERGGSVQAVPAHIVLPRSASVRAVSVRAASRR